jgi:hypothetical protein
VHTAYFEQDEVLKLVAANMVWEPAEADNPAGLQSMPPWLRKWFIAFKQGIAHNQIERTTLGKSHSLERAEPSRRKAG